MGLEETLWLRKKIQDDMQGLLDRINTPSERTLVTKVLKATSSTSMTSPAYTTVLTIEGAGRILYFGGYNNHTSNSISVGGIVTVDAEEILRQYCTMSNGYSTPFMVTDDFVKALYGATFSSSIYARTIYTSGVLTPSFLTRKYVVETPVTDWSDSKDAYYAGNGVYFENSVTIQIATTDYTNGMLEIWYELF